MRINLKREHFSPAFWLAVLLFCLTVLVYAPACANQFVNYDDPEYFTDNPMIRSGLTWPGIQWAFTTTRTSNWHPLTWLSLQLDVSIHGLDTNGQPKASAVYITTVFLHAANAALLSLTVSSMLRSAWRGAIVAVLFALHPLRVQSVAWASERKDVLCAFFFILGLVAYVWYVHRPSMARYFCVIICAALSLLAKPMAVTFPLLLLCLDYWPLARTHGTPYPIFRTLWYWLIVEKVPLLALAAVAGAMTLWAQAQSGTIGALAALPIRVRIQNTLVAYVRYLWMWLWPQSLAVYYPHPYGDYPPITVVLCAGILLCISWWAWHRRRQQPHCLIGWLWYVLLLLPVIGLVQTGSQALADRYTYLPMIGIALAVTCAGADWAAGRTARWVMIGALLAALGFWLPITEYQIGTWHDSVALWRQTARVTPLNFVVATNLGEALAHQGNWPAAREEFDLALKLEPDNPSAYTNLASVAEHLGRDAEAIDLYRHALRIRPDAANAHAGLALVLTRLGDFPGAKKEFGAALQFLPNLKVAHEQLAWLDSLEGDLAGAILHGRQTIQLDPENAGAHFNLAVNLLRDDQPAPALAEINWLNLHAPDMPQAKRLLVQALLQQGRIEEALPHASSVLVENDGEALGWLGQAHAIRGDHEQSLEILTKAVKRDSGLTWLYAEIGSIEDQLRRPEHARRSFALADAIDPSWRDKMRQRAWRLATRSESDARSGVLAVHLASIVVRASGPPAPDDLDTLAAALAECGRFPEACDREIEAIRLAPAAWRPAMKRRLAAYQRHEPCRQPPRTKDKWQAPP